MNHTQIPNTLPQPSPDTVTEGARHAVAVALKDLDGVIMMLQTQLPMLAPLDNFTCS